MHHVVYSSEHIGFHKNAFVGPTVSKECGTKTVAALNKTELVAELSCCHPPTDITDAVAGDAFGCLTKLVFDGIPVVSVKSGADLVEVSPAGDLDADH